MAYDEITLLLGGWPGFEIAAVTREPGGTRTGAPQITITLAAVPGTRRYCSRCGRATRQLHDVTERRVRELPILEAETWLVVPLARLACPRCGPTVEGLPWLDRYARMTKRFAESVARLAQVLPIKQVAEWFGLSWDTVQAIDQAALERRLGPVELTGVRRIVIDEFAIQKGHRYATVVAEPETRRVLWVGRGRGREVIDRVRVDETNRVARAAGPGPARDRRRVIKGARWLLLRNATSLERDDRIRLRELLAANRRLWVVYVLKDALKHLWRYKYRGAADRAWQAWQAWYGWAVRSRIPALVKFARQLKAKLPGILAHCRYLLHTGVLEGINNKIKVLKRIAYGYRNDAYFFLKIRAAFPGNP